MEIQKTQAGQGYFVVEGDTFLQGGMYHTLWYVMMETRHNSKRGSVVVATRDSERDAVAYMKGLTV